MGQRYHGGGPASVRIGEGWQGTALEDVAEWDRSGLLLGTSVSGNTSGAYGVLTSFVFVSQAARVSIARPCRRARQAAGSDLSHRSLQEAAKAGSAQTQGAYQPSHRPSPTLSVDGGPPPISPSVPVPPSPLRHSPAGRAPPPASGPAAWRRRPRSGASGSGSRCGHRAPSGRRHRGLRRS
jgi:hypothetical protein